VQVQLQWWVTSLAIPAFFVVLGATVGLVFGEIKDWFKEKRTKRAFLKAVSIELSALKSTLEQAIEYIEGLMVLVQVNGHAPQLVPRWGTSVFGTQLGKLRDVADPLVVQVIETYMMVSVIERGFAQANHDSQNFASAKPGNEKATAQSRLNSTLRVLNEEITKTTPKIADILLKLN
jgi:hypothetical protein